MKVGFDISQIAHGGGVSTYTQNLARELSKDKTLEMRYFYSSLRKPYQGNLPNVKSFPIPPSVFEVVFNKVRVIPIESLIGGVDVFHSSDWTQPKTSAKKVTTYHDVIPLKFPQWSHPKIVEVHKKRLDLVENEIDMVIAVSETTKKDLLEVSKIPEEKVVVIYEGVGEEFKRKDEGEVEKFRAKYNLPKEFVLAIGGIGERKNIARIKESAKNYNLIITGENLPRLSDEEMPFLYSAAKVLFYSSLYEGFGLPILESMACGTPVITSNISVMPEITKGAALLVDPYDIEDMKLKLKTLVQDEDIREDMIGSGILRASDFRWDNCAAETKQVYEKVLKGI